MKQLPILYEKHPAYTIWMDHTFSGLISAIEEVFPLKDRTVCIFTDSRVAGFYDQEITALFENHCKRCISFVFPEGETSKNLSVIQDAYAFMIQEQMNRKDLILALGGGVVGDMAGFTAATFLRGISFVQVPTSVLAMADSSIGGKTGVDFQGYKNMVGAFYQPKAVYMNVSVLKTLEIRHYWNGFGEMIKHGILGDEGLFSWLSSHISLIEAQEDEALLYLVEHSCAVKKKIVEEDPLEKGNRALLNMGHTLGHAIEKWSSFSFLHGECVSLGTVAASYISWQRGLLSREELQNIVRLFSAFHLPVKLDAAPEDIPSILSAVKKDKKSEGTHLRFILADRIGHGIIVTDVTKEEQEASLQWLRKGALL